MVFDVEDVDVGGAVEFVEGVFGVDFGLDGFTEFDDLVHPDFPVGAFEMVEGLGLHCVVEEIHADFHDHTVFDHGFEILLRKRQRRRHRHA